MKYGAIATSISEWLALAGGRVPIPILDAFFSILKARVLMAGVRLGVFEALSDGPRTSKQLAESLALDKGCLELLLRTLAHSEYLVPCEEGYALSRLAKETMVAGSEKALCGYVEWNYTQWEFLGHLEELIRTGEGLNFHSELRDKQSWSNYQRGMLEIARYQASVLAAQVPVPDGATRLLDLGGSHGLFGAAICREHPPMRSTVIDLAQAIDAARELAKSEGIDDVVEHREGDLVTSDLGVGSDVVLLANVLHHFRPEQHVQILRRSRRALRPGGTIAIWEIEAPMSDSKVSHGDGVALYFRLTSSAGAYHAEHFVKQLRRAGFKKVEVNRPVMADGSVLVVGTNVSASFGPKLKTRTKSRT